MLVFRTKQVRTPSGNLTFHLGKFNALLNVVVNLLKLLPFGGGGLPVAAMVGFAQLLHNFGGGIGIILQELVGSKVYIDQNDYYVKEIDKILGILASTLMPETALV